MTAKEFRDLALALPEATEAQHLGHPDFRVCGKIFATLEPEKDSGMAKLPPEEQARLVQLEPDVYRPASGAWGRLGCTIIQLHAADRLTVNEALVAAWRNTAPKRLVEQSNHLDCGDDSTRS
ncbi:MAG: MmcQ/YjbR family DNA-binding protein [Planctomycetota bacterium]